MIRLGKALEKVSVEHYGAFYAGQYRGLREMFLIDARMATDPELRVRCIRSAIDAHRSMQRCWRELRRDQLARGGI